MLFSKDTSVIYLNVACRASTAHDRFICNTRSANIPATSVEAIQADIYDIIKTVLKIMEYEHVIHTPRRQIKTYLKLQAWNVYFNWIKQLKIRPIFTMPLEEGDSDSRMSY
ncbi:hypothetical protein LPH54_05065 [Xylella taiwanensis]|nr:hypothetical protein [Xylella taiwanensis]UFS50481.1 hypothetical protein LPH54_05065 [Xylella taiwanensis]